MFSLFIFAVLNCSIPFQTITQIKSKCTKQNMYIINLHNNKNLHIKLRKDKHRNRQRESEGETESNSKISVFLQNA